jgi:hypothetical protein
MTTAELKKYNAIKDRNLVLGILFDIMGMLSFGLPVIGEIVDIVWAPVSGFLMMWMYKGSVGKFAGILATAEELLPATDVIPSFTLTWLYVYKIQKQPELKTTS